MQQHKDYMAGLFHHTASSNVMPYYVKGKAVPLHAKKAQRGGKGTALPIFNPGTWRGWVVTDITQLLYPREWDLVLTVQENGWDSEPIRMGEENLAPHWGLNPGLSSL